MTVSPSRSRLLWRGPTRDAARPGSRRGAVRSAICTGLCALLVVFAGPSEARRIALVVGNDSYKNVQPLRNARQDAKSIAEVLRGLGFDVTLKQDLSLTSMKAALREFKSRVGGGDEVIFYFSGHGVQFDGTNYLVPIDIVAENEQQVADDAVPLQRVLDDLRDQKARFALAIVDACRDNPFKGQGRAIGGRGLAPVMAANGQMVLYSAGAGQAALDRLGPNDTNPNGVFTRVLIKQMQRPGVPADRVLKNVRDEVVQLAKNASHEQVPALYDQSIGEFYFRPGAPEVPGRTASEPATVSTTPAGPPVHVQSASELEESYWDRIRNSTDPEDFQEYGRQFPKGAHTAEASLMARKLARQMAASPGRARARSPPGEMGVAKVTPLAATPESRPSLPASAVPENDCPANMTAHRNASASLSCRCSAKATASGPVYGSDIYTDDSSVCRAALHAGVISPAGGAVTVMPAPGRAIYDGVARNGVTSGRWPAYDYSFRFGGVQGAAGPAAERAADCPRTLLESPARRTPFVCYCAGAATQSGIVYGTDVYTADSSICRAALHAGAAPAEGGAVTVRPRPGQGSYAASLRNGVSTAGWNAYGGSFSVEGRSPSLR